MKEALHIQWLILLVAVDGSEYAEKAFEYASYLAKKCGSGLLIVHVIEEFVSVGQSILKELEQRDLEMLKKYKSRAKESSAITSIESRGNDVAEEILRVADKQKVDTIVIGSRGAKASKEFLMGSAPYKVTHYAKCPVVIVR